MFSMLFGIRKKGCTVSTVTRVYFDEINHYVYPDTSVVCGGIEVSGKMKMQ